MKCVSNQSKKTSEILYLDTYLHLPVLNKIRITDFEHSFEKKETATIIVYNLLFYIISLFSLYVNSNKSSVSF